MKILRTIVFPGLLLLLLANCEKDNDDTDISVVNQRVYFQYDYINFAWGHQHTGWLMDSSGNVYCYTEPENWYNLDSLGVISSENMDSNLLQTDSICFKIDKKELFDKTGLIKNAAKGELSKPEHEMYDAGATAYFAYIYKEDTKTYKIVVLKQTGDYMINNSSSESVELYEWLDSINYQVHKAE